MNNYFIFFVKKKSDPNFGTFHIIPDIVLYE